MQIAKVGNTGMNIANTTGGAHLHMEIRKKDPMSPT